MNAKTTTTLACPRCGWTTPNRGAGIVALDDIDQHDNRRGACLDWLKERLVSAQRSLSEIVFWSIDLGVCEGLREQARYAELLTRTMTVIPEDQLRMIVAGVEAVLERHREIHQVGLADSHRSVHQ